MTSQTNRLLLEYERLFRDANRSDIQPILPKLRVDDLRPVARLVAHARASYLAHVYELARRYDSSTTLPSEDEMAELRALRERFTELMQGAQAFETAIRRGYLDVNASEPSP